MELTLALLAELFKGWPGVLSFIVIMAMVAMCVFFLRLFLKGAEVEEGENIVEDSAH